MVPTMVPSMTIMMGSIRLLSALTVDLALVELGDFHQHQLQLAGFLSGSDHLQHDAREQAGLGHRDFQRTPRADLVADIQNRVAVDPVAGGLGHRLQGVHQRHAGAEHGGQGPAEARHHGFLDQRPEHGQLQGDPVHQELEPG